MKKFDFENSISKKKNYLINLSNENNSSDDLQYLLNNFCGTIVNDLSEITDNLKIRVYAVGDIKQIEKEKN